MRRDSQYNMHLRQLKASHVSMDRKSKESHNDDVHGQPVSLAFSVIKASLNAGSNDNLSEYTRKQKLQTISDYGAKSSNNGKYN